MTQMLNIIFPLSVLAPRLPAGPEGKLLAHGPGEATTAALLLPPLLFPLIIPHHGNYFTKNYYFRHST